MRPALAESAMYLSPSEKYQVMRKVCQHGALYSTFSSFLCVHVLCTLSCWVSQWKVFTSRAGTHPGG